MTSLFRDLGIALVAGLISVAVNFYFASAPSTGSSGFPFPVTHVIPGCFGPGYPLGCLAYDSQQLILDGVFWTGLILVIVVFIDWARTRATSGVGESGRDKSADSSPNAWGP